MKFWDTSALAPLLRDEPMSGVMEDLLREDADLLLWWGTPVECTSALGRNHRAGDLSLEDLNGRLAELQALRAAALEVQPSDELRARAMRLLLVHPLRAADALQLAAALLGCRDQPQSMSFVCADTRLREAAQREGFEVQPSVVAPPGA